MKLNSVNTQEELLRRVMAVSLHIQQDPHIFQWVQELIYVTKLEVPHFEIS